MTVDPFVSPISSQRCSATGPYVVNVGLPRTGTSSFGRAAELLGFKSLHIWHEAENDVSTLAKFMQNNSDSRRFLSQYHALSDTPFYALRDVFEFYYPETSMVFTTRPKRDWVRSMITYRSAGGQFLAQMYRLTGPPYTQDQAEQLGAAYDHHHQAVCGGLPSIDLGSLDDRRKWKVLCAALPNPEACLARSASLSWPHENSSTQHPSSCITY